MMTDRFVDTLVGVRVGPGRLPARTGRRHSREMWPSRLQHWARSDGPQHHKGVPAVPLLPRRSAVALKTVGRGPVDPEVSRAD